MKFIGCTFKPSIITPTRIGKKGKSGYTERNLKSNAKECLKLKFSGLTGQSFEELWKEMKDNFQKLNVDLMIEINLVINKEKNKGTF